MHALHKILVYTPDVHLDKNLSRTDLIKKIRTYAEKVTNEFQGPVFDWRETDTAGRWSLEFPENVLLGGENRTRILEELVAADLEQKRSLEKNIERFAEWETGDVAQIAHEIWAIAADNDPEEPSKRSAPYYFMQIARRVYGEYEFDSFFYDAYAETARITERTMESVKTAPEDWAMVLFDYHN